jgi:hypothetical protein
LEFTRHTAIWLNPEITISTSLVTMQLPLLTSQWPLKQRPGLIISSFTCAQLARQSLTFEQHPPNISASIPPTASHCGIVSMNILPAIARIFFEAGRASSMPYISAFSRDGAALMTLGTIMSPSEVVFEAWRSRSSVERRRAEGIEMLPESVLPFFAIEAETRVRRSNPSRAACSKRSRGLTRVVET